MLKREYEGENIPEYKQNKKEYDNEEMIGVPVGGYSFRPQIVHPVVIGKCDRSCTEDREIIINNWHFYDDGTIQYLDGERLYAPACIKMIEEEVLRNLAYLGHGRGWSVVETSDGIPVSVTNWLDYDEAMRRAGLDPKLYPDQYIEGIRSGLNVHVIRMRVFF